MFLKYVFGTSDHHKMISAIVKVHFIRGSPKPKYYLDYRKFNFYFSSGLSRQLDSTFCFIKENENYKELYEFSRFPRALINLLNILAFFKEVTTVPLRKPYFSDKDNFSN